MRNTVIVCNFVQILFYSCHILPGACWAYAAAEAIESFAAIQSGTLYELSTEQVQMTLLNFFKIGLLHSLIKYISFS